MPRAPSALRFSLAAIVLTLACAVARGEEPTAPPVNGHDFLAAFKDSFTTMPDAGELTTKATIYVPAYSRVYGAAAGSHKLLELSTTLRIDNTSATKPLVIESIEYYETAGKLVQSYLSEPLALRPFGTIEIVIPAAAAWRRTSSSDGRAPARSPSRWSRP